MSEQREMVIKSLDECLKTPRCQDCPWDSCERADCASANMPYDLVYAALEMLKEQEARVMTLDEVKQAKGRDVWLELSGNIAEDVLTAATIEGCGTGGICTRYESLSYVQYRVKPYGWRCWTSRPTDEQREAVKWDG